MRPSATAKYRRLREALRDISLYPLPVYSFASEKYVPLQNAAYLQEMAKDALEPVKKKAKP